MQQRNVRFLIAGVVLFLMLTGGIIFFLRNRQGKVSETNDLSPTLPSETSVAPLSRPVLSPQDSDFDGLSNEEERQLGTDPQKFDTDGDGLDDKAEQEIGTDPKVADFSLQGIDTDGDGVLDALETKIGFNPNNADSDGDGVADAAELDARAAGMQDSDNDGLIDPDEAQYGSDSKNSCTDGD